MSAGSILVLNGPNLNLLGTREPDIYGHESLQGIAEHCAKLADELGVEVTFKQSNHEGELVDWIQQAIGTDDAIVINAGAYTHTSVAIHDALKSYDGYLLELHISNPHLREPFRHLSYISPVADSVIAGLGVSGYAQAIRVISTEIFS